MPLTTNLNQKHEKQPTVVHRQQSEVPVPLPGSKEIPKPVTTSPSSDAPASKPSSLHISSISVLADKIIHRASILSPYESNSVFGQWLHQTIRTHPGIPRVCYSIASVYWMRCLETSGVMGLPYTYGVCLVVACKWYIEERIPMGAFRMILPGCAPRDLVMLEPVVMKATGYRLHVELSHIQEFM
eukprot:PhF_6_TR6075/c0_g1_i1/m.8848